MSYIVGIGTWLPKEIRTNDAWPSSFSDRSHDKGDRTFNDIPSSTEDEHSAMITARDLALEANDPFLGSIERRVADPSMTAIEAESLAGLNALEDACIDPREVDLVISNTLVGERVAPSSAPGIAHRIGATEAFGFGMEAACASSVLQLSIAEGYIESGMARTVLLTQSHLLLRAMPFEHPAVPGLGDVASAMVLRRHGGGKTSLKILNIFSQSHGEFWNAVSFVRGQTDETDPPWWKAGGDFRLGSRDPKLAKQLMQDTVTFGSRTIQQAAEEIGVSPSRIKVLASVQPRGFLPGAIVERLGLERSVAVTTFKKIAHVGSCGPVCNLAEAQTLGRFHPGDIVAMYGQGAGFTRSSAILEVG